MPDTVMSAAMKAAGVKRNETRIELEELAAEALKAHPKDRDKAKAYFVKAVRLDADLLWELFSAHRDSVVHSVLSMVQHKLDKDRTAAAPLRAAVSVVQPSVKTKSRAPEAQHEEWIKVPSPEVSEAARVMNEHQKELRRGEAIGALRAQSLLDTFTIGAKAIGDCTVREAKKFSADYGVKVLFVEMLTKGLPELDVIRKHRTGRQANEIWSQAQARVHA